MVYSPRKSQNTPNLLKWRCAGRVCGVSLLYREFDSYRVQLTDFSRFYCIKGAVAASNHQAGIRVLQQPNG